MTSHPEFTGHAETQAAGWAWPEGRSLLTPALDVSLPPGLCSLEVPSGRCAVLAIFTSFNLVVPMHFNNASVKNQRHMVTGLFAIISLEIESIFSVFFLK